MKRAYLRAQKGLSSLFIPRFTFQIYCGKMPARLPLRSAGCLRVRLLRSRAAREVSCEARLSRVTLGARIIRASRELLARVSCVIASGISGINF